MYLRYLRLFNRTFLVKKISYWEWEAGLYIFFEFIMEYAGHRVVNVVF